MIDFLVSLTYPPHLTLVLLVLGTIAWLARKRRISVSLAMMGVAWSALWSVPACSDWLRNSLEQRHPLVDEKQLPQADAIVVLGGGVHYPWIARENVDPYDLKSSRLAAGARAWLARRAPVVILSGGGGGRRGTEAGMMAEAIGKLGVPPSAIVLEEKSRSTEENASNTARLAAQRGIRRILLVTSALHMPRAHLLFERAGMEVVAVPVPEIARRARWQDKWLPATGALWRSGRALKEYAGLAALEVT